MSSSHYTHGSSEAEQQRLTALNRRLNERCIDAAQLAAGERVVDFGAGLGQYSRMMARVTGVPVLGLERSPKQIAEALRQAAADDETAMIEMRQGDVLDPPLRDDELGQFDVAHARFVLEHIPDPLQVVRNMARAVRPGGRVILSDDDYDGLRLWPEPPGFSSVWNAYQRTYDRHCNDPIVGRRLVQLLHQADLRPRRNTLVFFGGCAGDPDFEDVVRNIASIVDEAIDDIVATGLSRDAVTAGLDSLIAWSKAPDSAVWFGMSWAEGIRPL
ncbi:methyltransferase domain-containing protein [Rhizobium ruizarguesonis]|uniref:Methyltransferase domain-containing protein n=2 Tax=Rhizobium ruizarguesonis TaxID=2081791 RepID=A0AAE8QBT7_9HYPH|nr:methyltransferase domain-containing protein [Rhizobium ruizarguesonis]TBY59117.1 methyltransferase domain-containing protein [Rhizobium leguminosarum bv. viciae]TAW55560.1 methyltransferase domain-containing protein [Rhizobium ruizarguesonis]TBA79480.1 methyltransferase domain-containing protein [Rhizobium ruizarguesonis]TBB21060.1 methyltransferase domain-containing protein [Rhizobium ruizarguesonis]